MVVKSIFKDVDYPEDKKSIEHIIVGYETTIERYLKSNDNKLKRILLGMSLVIAIWLLKVDIGSFTINLLYMLPTLFCTLYEIFITVKKRNMKDTKDELKSSIFGNIVMMNFSYISAIMLQIFIYKDKATVNTYWFNLLLLLIVAVVAFIVMRIKTPKKFIKDLQYKHKKMSVQTGVIGGAASFLVVITSHNRPYRLLFAGSYFVVGVMAVLVTYEYFMYKQYDKIQELKEQVNFVPKKK